MVEIMMKITYKKFKMETDIYRSLFDSPQKGETLQEDEFQLAKRKKYQEIKQNIEKGVKRPPKKEPVLESLYKDALIRKEKGKLIQETALLDAQLTSSASKVGVNSHKITLRKIEREIENAILESESQVGMLTLNELRQTLVNLGVLKA